MRRAAVKKCCTVFVTLLAARAHASPFQIKDLDATERWEIKVLAEYERSDEERLVTLPAFDIAFGVVPQRLEMSVEFGRSALRTDEGERIDGLSDFELAAKWTILRPTDEGTGFFLTTEPELLIPTGADGLTEDVWRLEVPLMIGKQFGRVRLAGLAGYSHPFGEGEHEIPFAALALVQATEELRVGGELFGDARTNELSVDIGFKWEFIEGMELQGLIARTIRSDEEYVTYGKLVFEIEF